MITETLSIVEALWILFSLIATCISFLIIFDAVLDLMLLNILKTNGRKRLLANSTIHIEGLTLAINLLFLIAGVILAVTLQNPDLPQISPINVLFVIVIVLNAIRSTYSYYVRLKLA